MPIEWGAKYVLGIDSIDDQHKALFALINQMERSVREGNSREVVGKVIGDLVQYTLTHFTDEEKLMQDAGFSELEAHKKEHANLLAQVAAFKQGHETGKSPMTIQLMGFLVNWLTNHIDKTDRQYIPFMKKPEVEQPPRRG